MVKSLYQPHAGGVSCTPIFVLGCDVSLSMVDGKHHTTSLRGKAMLTEPRFLLVSVYLSALVLALLWLYDHTSIEPAIVALLIVAYIMAVLLRRAH